MLNIICHLNTNLRDIGIKDRYSKSLTVIFSLTECKKIIRVVISEIFTKLSNNENTVQNKIPNVAKYWYPCSVFTVGCHPRVDRASALIF